MSESASETATGLMARVWASAARPNLELSPVLSAVKDVMLSHADSSFGEFLDATYGLLRRIATFTGSFVSDPVFLAACKGEWQITNADLETWARVSMWGNRYLPNKWRTLSYEITDALHGKRRWQAWERFSETGVTPEHRLLAANLGWDFSLWRSDSVSLYVQGKRPFGNSDIEGDIADAVGWDQPWHDDEDWDGSRPSEFNERAWDLFEELQFAVPMILREAACSGRPGSSG